MKIAVATIDGIQLSPHFGRSAGFVIFEVEGKAIQGRELRSNNHTSHAQGLCHGEYHEHGTHSHSGIVGLLQDCQVVLCGGMGSSAAQALKDNGICPHVLMEPCSADEALQKFLSGAVVATDAVHCTLPFLIAAAKNKGGLLLAAQLWRWLVPHICHLLADVGPRTTSVLRSNLPASR